MQGYRGNTGMNEKGHIIEAEFKATSRHGRVDLELYQGEDEALNAVKDELEVITFRLDNEEYAIDIHQVKEVIKMREITEVPRAPQDILGVISLRGTIVSVMNLRGKIGLPLKDDGERILIVKDGAALLGLLVDSVRHVVRVPKSSIEPPPAINTMDSDVIRGIGRYKGGMFILLDMDKILERM